MTLLSQRKNRLSKFFTWILMFPLCLVLSVNAPASSWDSGASDDQRLQNIISGIYPYMTEELEDLRQDYINTKNDITAVKLSIKNLPQLGGGATGGTYGIRSSVTKESLEADLAQLERDFLLIKANILTNIDLMDLRLSRGDFTSEELEDLFSASRAYQEFTNEVLYSGYESGESQNIFDGMSYFLSAMISGSLYEYPNQVWVPISVGDIMIIVKNVGEKPARSATAYVERGIIKKQLSELINRGWVGGYDTSEAQTKALYDNGIWLAQEWGLEFGQPLTEAQTFEMPRDLIWPEYRIINGVQVIVPIVYLTNATYNTRVDSINTIAVGSADLRYDSFLIDGGTIIAEREAILTAKDSFINEEGSIIGGDLVISAGRSIENLSGLISGQDVTLAANRIENNTLVVRHEFDYGYNDTAKQLATITAVGELNINASADVVSQAGVFIGGDGITIKAGQSIALVTQQVSEYHSESGELWSDTSSSVTNLQTQLTGSDISLLAGTTIELEAAVLESPGMINLLAGMGIFIVNAFDKESFENTFEASGSGLFGAEETESEKSQKNKVVRTLIKAGKDLGIRTLSGDILLRAVNISSDASVAVAAEDGSIHMELAKELDFYSYESDKRGLFVFSTVGKGHNKETAVYTEIIAQGGLVLDANIAINVQYAGEGSLDETIDKLAAMPTLSWMREVRERDDGVWEEVELAYEEWDFAAQGLTEAGAIIVAIVMAVATGGAGLAIVGGEGVMAAAVQAVVQAAVTTMSTQAASSLISNGFDIGATFKDLGSKDNVKALAMAMVTAGVVQAIDLPILEDKVGAEVTSLEIIAELPDLATQAIEAVTVATVNVAATTAVSTLVSGGSLDDFEEGFTQSLVQYGINKLGQHMAQRIGKAFDDPNSTDNLDVAFKYISHAGAGCILGLATAENSGAGSSESACTSGAGGAVIGEIIASQYRTSDDVIEAQEAIEGFVKENGDFVALLKEEQFTDEQIQGVLAKNSIVAEHMVRLDKLRQKGVDIARLGAAIGAFAAGADASGINIAADLGENAAANNALYLVYGFKKLLEAISNSEEALHKPIGPLEAGFKGTGSFVSNKFVSLQEELDGVESNDPTRFQDFDLPLDEFNPTTNFAVVGGVLAGFVDAGNIVGILGDVGARLVLDAMKGNLSSSGASIDRLELLVTDLAKVVLNFDSLVNQVGALIVAAEAKDRAAQAAVARLATGVFIAAGSMGAGSSNAVVAMPAVLDRLSTMASASKINMAKLLDRLPGNVKFSAEGKVTVTQVIPDSKWTHLVISSRHLPNKVSIPKKTGNTMLTVSTKEVAADLAEIHLLGDAIRSGETFAVSSGRVYGIHNGSVHPISGPGTVNITSPEYNILVTARKNSLENAHKSLNVMTEKGYLSAAQHDRTLMLLDLMSSKGL
ncbi:MAG: DUF637 domain-containing protein [Colwellia sp.]|nr:DUF637 domain-containing protein [Colwellia sp.]